MRGRRTASCFALATLLACGGAPDAGEATAPAGAGKDAVPADDLLAQARRGMHAGQLPPDVRERILASATPDHVRAARLLRVIDGGEPAAAPDPVPRDPAPQSAPRVAPMTAPPPPVATGIVSEAVGGDPRPPRPAEGGPGVLTGLELARSGGNVTLVVRASGGVLMGLANQPHSGIVRLVIDSGGALPKVLAARPRLEGVAVTAVTKATNSVFVTLELDPGWRVGPIRKLPGGARLVLERPE